MGRCTLKTELSTVKYLSEFVCTYHPGVLGSNPILLFTFRKFCSIFFNALRKGQK